MNLKQVLSIEQMKHLQQLGLDTSDASIYWARRSHGSRLDDKSKSDWFLSLQKEFMVCGFTSYEVIPTLTLQDILDKLPHYLNPFPSKQILFAWMIERDTIAYRNVEDIDDCLKHFTDDLLIDAAYEMLCWCIENGYIGKEKGD
jgi:hypothetical protein